MSSEVLAALDETERTLGISEYLTSGQGFSAVVKARYSDFVVHEVGEDGTIAKLTSLDVPRSMKTEVLPKVEEKPKSESKEMNKKPYDWPGLESELTEIIKDSSTAKKLMSVLKLHNESKECEEKYVTMPPLEKDQRRVVHEWVRNSLPCARSETCDFVRIWHVKFEKEMANYKTFWNPNKKRQKLSWPKDRPDFLRFVLYKENLDTTTATKEISRKGGKARISYAGMKDKRGITTQYCTLFRTEPQSIVSRYQKGGGGNSKQKGNSVAQVGNFEYVSEELRLGKLKGNRFDIVLRNVQMNDNKSEIDKSILSDAVTAMKKTGFVNYFGTQRFGKFNDTHKVGIEILKGNYRRAIDIIMEPKAEERPDAAKGRKEWLDRFQGGETPENEAECAKRIMKLINRFMTAEMSIVQSLHRKPMDYKRAFGSIPKTLRMMFLHAVQSLIWNRAASYRISSMKSDQILVGDLVQTEGEPKYVVVTQKDIDDKKYTLEDVVIPMVGKKSKFPTNELGDYMKKKLPLDIGITIEMFQQIQFRDLALYGDYRKLICRPTDLDFIVKEYYDPLQPLLETDLMKLHDESIQIEPKKEDEKVKVGMIVGFTLPPSSYATVALRELMKKPTSNEYQKELKL